MYTHRWQVPSSSTDSRFDQTRSVLASPPTCMSPLYGMHKYNVLEASYEKVVGMPEANHEWKRTPRGTPSFSNTITKPLRHDIIKTKLSAFMEKLSQHLSNSVERATGADKNREVTGARLLPHARSLERYRESFSSPSEKSHICQMKAWPYRQECRGHDPTKKNLLCC